MTSLIRWILTLVLGPTLPRGEAQFVEAVIEPRFETSAGLSRLRLI